MENTNEKESSKIVDFFRNSTVFLTGGFGFIGKIILHKLFSTCDVSRVYLLVRKKGSKCSSERMRELMQDQAFIHLKIRIPDLEDRIKLVEGDCSFENLGLSTNDETALCESVDFIIHGAAAMNMVGLLKTSVEINIGGTLRLVNLANKMTNLKAFVHLSAMGAFMERDEIEEKLYKSHIEYEDFLYLLKLDKALPMDKHDSKRIYGKKLSMYGLTKAAAENIFIREKISVPVVIFRFPLSLPCAKEPMPGWPDTFYGPNGIFALPGLGIYLATYWEGDITFDYTPADLAVNALLATIQHANDKYQENKNTTSQILPFVYNYSTKHHENTIPFHSIMLRLKKDLNCTWHRFYSNKLRFMIYTVEFGYIPAIVIDFFGTLVGKNFRYYQTYKKLVESNFKLAQGSTISSEVITNNVQDCWDNLNTVDKRLFSFDLNEVDWDEYLPLFTNSVRGYIRELKEKNERIRLAAYWTPWVRVAFKALQLIIVACCVYFFTIR